MKLFKTQFLCVGTRNTSLFPYFTATYSIRRE